jgi:hypothetical protein
MLGLTKESAMPRRNRLLPGLFIIATLPVVSPIAAALETSSSVTESAGYLISKAFTIDPRNHSVVSPPEGARAGDLLWIRPLRLNADEYLVLQRCNSADCSDAQVVRAWNAYGAMGPLPILSNKVRMEVGATYMIWMQRIPIKGGGTFSKFQSASAPLTFVPSGSDKLFAAADLEGARQRGPTPIAKASLEGRSFVATFQGGSVVRMQMLRAGSENSAQR